MAHFYRKLLEESQQQHEETMAITEAKRPIIGPQGPMPNLTITKPPNFTPKSDLELARLAKDQGKEVELNDDNQIVDKRELLSGGLNLSTPNTRRLGFMTSTQTAPAEPVQAHRAAGTAASRREINERRAREIQVQMEEERSRLLSEQQRADREAQDKAIARRNTEDDVQSARERYLQRKRQKLEKPEAVTADGT
jgi:coiled-coil domain-containing protein 55